MHDFDTERAAGYYDEKERQFKLAGETFTIRRAVRPEAIDPWLDFIRRLAAEEPTTPVEQRAAMDDTITRMLEPASAKKWRQVRERDDDPVTGADLFPVAAFCVQIAGGRPLAPSSDSGDGSQTATAGTPSTDDSSSPAVEEQAASI